jgi:hypothetical protein
VRVVIMPRSRNPGPHLVPETPEPLAGYSDMHADAAHAADVDWHTSELETLAEQTLGGGRPL